MFNPRLRVARRPRLGTIAAAAALTVASLATMAASPAVASPAPQSAAVTTSCDSATGNAAYVRYLYMTILMRCPDAGAAPWVAKLDAGLSRSTLADLIDMSKENLDNNNVIGLYEGVLGRDPSATELKAGERSILNCRCDAHLVATLASSDEFYNQLSGDAASKDAQWLAIALENILDRQDVPPVSPDTYWGQKLGVPSTAASRYRVAMYLEHSTENAISWVGGIYGAALHRAPTPSRFGYWVGYLQGPGHWRTFRLFTTFLGTQEAYNLAQTNPGFPPPDHQKVSSKFVK